MSPQPDAKLPSMEQSRRIDLLRLLAATSLLIRAIASRLHLPGQDRLDLLRIANHLDRVVRRAGPS